AYHWWFSVSCEVGLITIRWPSEFAFFIPHGTMPKPLLGAFSLTSLAILVKTEFPPSDQPVITRFPSPSNSAARGEESDSRWFCPGPLPHFFGSHSQSFHDFWPIESNL